MFREKRVLVPLLASLALLTAVPDVSACPRIFARLRERFAGGGGGCFGGGQQQQFQQQQQQQDQQFQQGDQTQPINDTVSFGRVMYVQPQVAAAAAPVVYCPCVQQGVAPAPAPKPDTVSALPPPVLPKAAGEVSDESGGRPGVGIAAVEKRTTALEAQVATLTQQVAQLTAAINGQTTRSTVYQSATAAPVTYQAAPAVQYQTIPATSLPVYYGAPVRYNLGGTSNGCVGGSCGRSSPGLIFRN